MRFSWVQGKTYHCYVYQISSATVGDGNQTGKSVLYLNDSVPGGIVKGELPSTTGKPALMILDRFSTDSTTVVAAGPAAKSPDVASFDKFKFEVPSGWMRVRPDREKTLASLCRFDAEKKVVGMIKVDVGKPSSATARESAEALAGHDGTVSPKPISLDGMDAILVEIPSTDLSRPRRAAVVYRDDLLYLIMAAGTDGTDISNPFDQVLKNWHWASK